AARRRSSRDRRARARAHAHRRQPSHRRGANSDTRPASKEPHMTVIAERDTLYHDIVEASPVAILYADRDGIVRIWNAGAEQMLGVAEALVEKKLAALVIDLCGHGENRFAIGAAMREEVDGAVAYARRFGKVAVVGHSLGGRLALMSSADAIVAMSPSVMVQMSPQGKWMF